MNRFEQLHALLDQKPRANLGFFPTPLVRLDRLSEQLGVNLYVKRDDFSGMSLLAETKSASSNICWATRRKKDATPCLPTARRSPTTPCRP